MHRFCKTSFFYFHFPFLLGAIFACHNFVNTSLFGFGVFEGGGTISFSLAPFFFWVGGGVGYGRYC